jgi:hypothetical protein
MTAHARLNGKTYVFPDVTKVDVAPSQGATQQLVHLRRQNDEVVAYIRLGEGDFVTVGDEPKVAGDPI